MHEHCHCHDHQNCSESHEHHEEEHSHYPIICLVIGILSLITAFTLTKVDASGFSEIEWAFFSNPDFYHSYSFIAFILYSFGYLIMLTYIVPETLEGIKEHHFFSESMLMLIATLGAYGLTEFPEALFVILFSIIGETLEDFATGKARKSISNLVNTMPLHAHVIEEDGSIKEADPKNVPIGTVLEIRPGEKIALDGEVIEGSSSLDLSSINGESVPVEVKTGDKVYSGSILVESAIRIRTVKEYKDSTLTKIMDLVEKEQKNRSKSEKFITRFSQIYTPIVILVAALVFFIGYAVSGFAWEGALGGREWLYKALSILLISCPCALVISVPITFFLGIGLSSKIGVLVKGSVSLETLAKSKTFVFDKTGTLTKGNFILLSEPDKDNLRIAASLENSSTHPISKAIVKAYSGKTEKVDFLTNYPGLGIQGSINGKTYLIGNRKFLEENHVSNIRDIDTPYKVIYLGEKDGVMLETFIIADEMKEETPQTIANLKKEGVEKNVMLSGDNQAIAKRIATQAGLDEAKGELMPEEKLAEIKKLSKEKKTAYVGDGVNDSPSLLAADVGIAMGALGSDAAIEASDVVIMDDNLARVAEVRNIAKHTMKKVYCAVFLSLFIKVLMMVLVSFGLFGSYTMIVASLCDTGVMVIALLYVMTLMWYRPKFVADPKKK